MVAVSWPRRPLRRAIDILDAQSGDIIDTDWRLNEQTGADHRELYVTVLHRAAFADYFWGG